MPNSVSRNGAESGDQLWLTGLFANRAVWAALFLALSFALKITTFGDVNRYADETFYFLVGQQMHDGLLPYVDVWDRKPLGLFLIYYLIAGISYSVLSYQIVACLFAAATAFIIALIVRGWSDHKAGVLAGLGYLFVITPFEGSTGQTPDFYNLFVAGAALVLIRDMERLSNGVISWRSWLAMALCGIAITIKQTAVFEAIFFGLAMLFCLYRGGLPPLRILRIAAVAASIGAMPTLLIAGYYWQAGHWSEFWHAMVTSNFAKQAGPSDDTAHKALGLGLRLAIFAAFALWGLFSARLERPARFFLGGWIVAALVGFLSVPNFYIHYTLPLLVPLAVAAGLLFSTHRMGLVLFVMTALYAMLWHSPLRSEFRRDSVQSMEQLASLIRSHDGGGGLLVFDGPHYLYALTDKRVLSPLVFPHHLNHAIENNVSHLDTHDEVDRILAAKPGVVVMARHPSNAPVNAYSRSRVLEYVRRNCAVSGVVMLKSTYFEKPVVVRGDCARPDTSGG